MSKKNKAFFRQSLVALSTGLGALGTALILSYTSPALPSMKNDPDFQLTDDDASWIGSAVPASALLGTLVAGFLVDSLGRNRLYLFFIPPSIISWVCIALSPNVLSVIGGRILCGFCLGIQSVAGTVYSSECIEVDLRGSINIFRGVMWTFGQLLFSLAGKFFEWREIAWIAAILILPSFILRLYLPESPFFLLKSGKKSEAVKVMSWLRDSPTKGQKEINELLSVNKELHKDSVKIKDLFIPPNRWPVCVATLLFIFQQMAGINVLLYYSNSIFETVNSPQAPIDPATCSIMMTLTSVAANPICSYLVGIWKRKWLIRFTSKLMIGSLTMLSLYFYSKNNGGTLESLALALPLIPLLSVMVYVSAISLGWGPVPFIFLNEGLPSKVRGMASSVSISTTWILSFLITKHYFSVVNAFGFSSVFLSFGAMTLIGMFVVEFYVPETLGRSVAEMDQFYIDSYKKKIR